MFFGYGVPPEVYDHRNQARTPQQPKHGSRGSVRNLAGIKHALLVGVANQERAFLFRCVLRVDDAVVGQYPLLIEGSYRDDQGQSANYVVGGMEEDGIFRYQSCSNAMNGSFGGQLLFVPGSIDDPKGEKFFVDVAPFLLTKDPDIFFF